MIECHGKDKSDAVITLTFNNLEELNPVIVINNGFIKGENYEKYGRPSRIYVSVNETGMGNWFWLQDTPLKQTLNIGGMVPAPGTTDTITVKIAVYKDIVLNYYACIDAVRIEHIFNENYSLNQGVEAKPFIKMQGSYLTENLKSGKVSYTTGNLFFNDGKPWVPEGSNNGIGAILNIKAYNYNEPYSQRLEIYNGFQKDDYYEKNSRLKKFKITYKNKSEVFEIPDSKDVQIVNLSKLLKGCDEPVIDLQLEVIDSYKGSKYSDLCIDAIIAPKYDDSGK